MSETRFTDITALAEQAKRQTRQFLKQGAGHFQLPVPRVDIRFDLRGQSAGQVRLPTKGRPQVRYNLQLLAENREKFLQRTVPHESAHIIAYRVFGTRIRPHGDEWQQVMALFGADSSRCHSFDTSRAQARRVKRFAYHCSCREHDLSSIRHNRVLSGQVYLCRSCGDPLRPGSHSDVG